MQNETGNENNINIIKMTNAIRYWQSNDAAGVQD